MINDTIFVQIASYRDPECRNTVKDLYAKAKFPENISVGINWQFDAADDFTPIYEDQSYAERIRIVRYDRTEAKGVCWARAQTQKLYKDETYTLQVDSHMVFIEGWDIELIAMIETLKEKGVKKPVISHYPPNYTIEGKYDNWQGRMAPYVREDDQVVYFKMTGYKIDQNNSPAKPAASIAGGLMFADALCIKEIPYDPHLYFYGEEISLTTRFWTRGWDIYNPTKIVLWHLFKVEIKNGEKIDTRSIDTHWDDYPDEYSRLNNRSIYRTRHFFGTQYSSDEEVIKDLSLYSLGKQRSLYQFELFSGINFKPLKRGGFASKGLVFNETVVADLTIASEHMQNISKLPTRFDYAANLIELFESLGVINIVNLMSRYRDPLAPYIKPTMQYIGLDCNADNCRQNRFDYCHAQNVQHMQFDYFMEPLPICDALVAIDVFDKLNYAEQMSLLSGALNAGVKYLVGSMETLQQAPYYFPKPSFMVAQNSEDNNTIGLWKMKDIFIYCYGMDKENIALRQMILPILEQQLAILEDAMGDLESDFYEILYHIYSSISPKNARAIYNKPEVKEALINNLGIGKKAMNLLISMRYWEKFKPIADVLPELGQSNHNYTFMSALVDEYLSLYRQFNK
ncbi:MAG: GlcNAc-transferase family protein [Pseudomonadota bacterium]